MGDALKGIRRFSPRVGMYSYGGMKQMVDGDYVSARRAAQVIKAERATIARLSAELTDARASAAAAYERAAQVASPVYDLSEVEDRWHRGHTVGRKEATDAIRTLATEAETTALAEMLDAETRACSATVRKRIDDYVRECGSYDPSTGVTEFPGNGEEWISDMEEIEDALTARLDQRKEGV